jgi:hypothetical protein
MSRIDCEEECSGYEERRGKLVVMAGERRHRDQRTFPVLGKFFDDFPGTNYLSFICLGD